MRNHRTSSPRCSCVQDVLLNGETRLSHYDRNCETISFIPHLNRTNCKVASRVYIYKIDVFFLAAPRRTYGRRDGHSSAICSRPDCKVPNIKSGLMLQSEEEFVIEAIIGRRKCPYPFPQVAWQYLLKWEGMSSYTEEH